MDYPQNEGNSLALSFIEVGKTVGQADLGRG